jgi:deazaflavin-dependent oxidoreductase (nitroreductase family)
MTWQQSLNDVGGKVMSRSHRIILKVSGGRVLHSAFGMPAVELHTIGSKSGKTRTTMLTSPINDENRVILVASKGGDDRDPQWYGNLTAHPDVEIVIGGEDAFDLSVAISSLQSNSTDSVHHAQVAGGAARPTCWGAA